MVDRHEEALGLVMDHGWLAHTLGTISENETCVGGCETGERE